MPTEYNPRIVELDRLIKHHNYAYHFGMPTISDREYDALWLELRQLDPKNPRLWHTSQAESPNYTTPHSRPMLSLDKAMNLEMLQTFLYRVRNFQLIATPKLDGMGLVDYGNGDVVTLGDGKWGQRLLQLIPGMRAHHMGLATPARCEAIITNANWSPMLGKNQRNTACGIVNKMVNGSASPRELTHLSVVYYEDLYQHPDYSFRVEPWNFLDTPDQLAVVLVHQHEIWKRTFPVDGIVLHVEDERAQTMLGITQDYPLWAIAWKPPIQSATTSVDRIIWQVSRHNTIVPVVVYEPVELCGTTNTRATCTNARFVKTRKLCPGAVIRIGKAGEIIPQVLEVISTPCVDATMVLPQECPACKGPVEYDGVNLICTNQTCVNAMITKLDYVYSTAVPIVGISEKIFEHLVTSHPLFYQIFQKNILALLSICSSTKEGQVLLSWFRAEYPVYSEYLLNQVADIYRDGVLTSALIMSLSLKGLGKTHANSLAHFATYGTMPPGKTIPRAVLLEYLNRLPELKDLKDALTAMGVKINPVPQASSDTFSLTGGMAIPRNEIISTLGSLGWTYHETPNKNTKYIFIGDNGGRVSTKEAKATSLRTKSPNQWPIVLNDNDLSQIISGTWRAK